MTGMAYEVCEACEESVKIGGGISAIWSFEPDQTGGMALDFPSGFSAFLCFDCLDSLPEDATESDVQELINQP